MPASNRSVLTVLRIVCVLLVLAAIARIGWAEYKIQTSGLLVVTTTEPNASIIISQPNTQAALLGKDGVKVRLKPGIYQVSAKLSGSQTFKTVTIVKGKTTSTRINPIQKTLEQKSDTRGFVNFDVLANHGLSSDQINFLQDMLTTFAPQATTFSVQADSVAKAPRDFTTEQDFVINSTIVIDTRTYTMQLTYPDDQNITLTLTDPQSGAQVYTNYAPQNKDT